MSTRHLVVAPSALQGCLVTLDMIQAIVSKAVRGSLQARSAPRLWSISHPEVVCSPRLLEARYWQDLERLVLAPIVAAVPAGVEADAGIAPGGGRVAAAEALATRRPAPTSAAPHGGRQRGCRPRGKLCSGCRRLRYCGPACQKADWRAHKAACRELQRRKAAADGG